MSTADKEALAGTSLYTKFFLHFYDWQALKINCQFAWKCPSHHMLALYNKYVSSNHLDIGPGTGYFLNKCKFPASSPRIALMDLNLNCLATATNRVDRYKPEVYQCNVLEPIPIKIEPFDSVALMNLLHCLPGTMKNKAVVFKHIKDILNPGGYVFGSTILGKDIHHNYWAKRLLKYCNSKKYLTNYEDDYDSLKQGLDAHFKSTFVEIVGCMALFAAQK